jgi:hypothetical protein
MFELRNKGNTAEMLQRVKDIYLKLYQWDKND